MHYLGPSLIQCRIIGMAIINPLGGDNFTANFNKIFIKNGWINWFPINSEIPLMPLKCWHLKNHWWIK